MVKTDEVQSTATDWTQVRRGMHDVPLDLIFESAENARVVFLESAIDDLAELIKSCGGINNDAGKARPNATLGQFDGFELIDGARRFRALKKLGAPAMKLEIMEVFDGKATRQVAMMTRLGKVDLSPMELCREYHRMIEAGDYASVKDLAAGIGQSSHYRTIVAVMSLIKLQPEVADALEKAEISREHAIKIAAEKADDQPKILAMCFEPETVTIGSLPETRTRLVSVDRLASIIQSHFREAPKEKQQNLLDAAAANEKQREKATSLETTATNLLAGADDPEDEDGEDDDEDQQRRDRETYEAQERERQKLATSAPLPVVGIDAAVAADDARKFEILEQVKQFTGGGLRRALVFALDCLARERKGDLSVKTFGHFGYFKNNSSDGRRQSLANLKDDKLVQFCAAWALLDGVQLGFLQNYLRADSEDDEPVNDVPVAKDEIDRAIGIAAKMVVDGLQIDDFVLSDLRELGASNDDLYLLLSKYEFPCSDREFEGVVFRADETHMELWKKKLSYTGDDESFAVVEGHDYIAAIRKALDVPELKPKAKVKKVKKLSAEELDAMRQDAVRTVFQNCCMEDIFDGASDNELLAWICKQIGDNEAYQDFPAGLYCGRVRAWLNVPVLCVFRNVKDADENMNPLIQVDNEDLADQVRTLFHIPQRAESGVIDRTLNLKQLAEAVGKHSSWLATKDLPHDLSEDAKFYNADEVKTWIAEHVKERGKGVGGRPAKK